MASSGPTAVIERLIEDDYLHEQLRAGGDRLLTAYRRARAMFAEEAVKEPPRRRRRLPILVVGVGVLALVRSMHRIQQSGAPAVPPAR